MILLSIFRMWKLRDLVKKRNFLKFIVHFRFHIFRIYFVKWNYLEILRIYRREFRIILFPENFLRFNSTEIQLLRLPYDSNFCNHFPRNVFTCCDHSNPYLLSPYFLHSIANVFFPPLLPPEKFLTQRQVKL